MADCAVLDHPNITKPTMHSMDSALAKAALNLLAEIAAHRAGTPDARLSERLQALLADAERSIPEPVFAPEQFAYLPTACFDGQRVAGVDIAFAALFAVAETRLPLSTVSAGTPKVAAWRHSLRQWQRADASPSRLGGSLP